MDDRDLRLALGVAVAAALLVLGVLVLLRPARRHPGAGVLPWPSIRLAPADSPAADPNAPPPAGPRNPGPETERTRRSDRGEMPERFVVSAPDRQALEAVLAWARRHGVHVNGILPALSAVSLTLGDDASLQSLRAAVPDAAIEHDVWVFAPAFPDSGSRPGSGGVPFRDKTLEWLGVPLDRENRGEGVRIAMLDTAVQDHPALAGAAVTRLHVGDTPFPDMEGDYRGHGTAVASLLVGTGEEGVTGVVPGAELLAIEVLDANGVGNSFDLAAGILLAVEKGAAVINLSLGAYAESALVHRAIDEALAAGVAVVAAAGNDGADRLTYPAAYPGVIAVSAVDARGEHAGYANTGSEVDLAAPGVGVYAAWAGDNLVSFSGTSAAAPFVAGSLALVLAEDRDEDPGDRSAFDFLFAYADDNGAPGPDPVYGAGTLNVGRVMQRDEPGIVDAALSSHFLDNEARTETGIPLLVSAQNRGTEALESLEIITTMNGESTAHAFTDVAVGETVFVTLPVPLADLTTGKDFELDSRVRIPGLSADAVPENDQRTSVISLTPAPEQ